MGDNAAVRGARLTRLAVQMAWPGLPWHGSTSTICARANCVVLCVVPSLFRQLPRGDKTMLRGSPREGCVFLLDCGSIPW